MSIAESLYDLEILKNKLNEAEKGEEDNLFDLNEITKIFDKVEKITTELVKEYPFNRVSIYINNHPLKYVYAVKNKELTCTSLECTINENGYIDLDSLEISRSDVFFNESFIKIDDIPTFISDKVKRKEFIQKYNLITEKFIVLNNI